MKSNNFKNRLTALALCFTLLLGAAPITRAYAVNDESDTSSSQSDSDSTHRTPRPPIRAARILPTARIPRTRPPTTTRTLPQRQVKRLP
ncbi:MAG: hypothetical protein V8Q23_01040 [Eubacteriales bacterium]